jgi:tetratricopeptide (TPR) repeat protein
MKMSGKNNNPESPFLIERLMRETRRSMEAEEFNSEEEFREKMREVIAAGLFEQRLESLDDDPEEMAQELAFEAFEAEDGDKALELAEKALQADPDCVDALTIRAFLVSEDAGDLIDALEHAATCGERRLGEDFFSEFMGGFWPMVEARPYMRTIKQLAEVLWAVGRRFDAVENYINLLDLDPEDHMGNSSLLLSCYLAMGEVQRSWDLLEEHDDESAVFQYGWLLVYLMTGDEDAAEDALKVAMEVNPHVVPYLLGMGEELEGNPPTVRVGSQEEAQVVGQILGQAWEGLPHAMLWLHDRMVELGFLELQDGEGEEGEEEPRGPVH